MKAVAGAAVHNRPVGGVHRVPADTRLTHVMYATFASAGITRSAPGTEGRTPRPTITAVTCVHGRWQGGGAGPNG